MQYKLAIVVLALEAIGHYYQVVGENAFIDSAPEGYYKRKSLADCPSRFYSEDVSSALGFFIFGGRRAFLKEFPHMAAIGWTSKESSPPEVLYKCGGSLIAARFVLTAAHCRIDSDKVPPDTVRLGDTNLATVEDDDTAQQFKIVSFTVHENFKKNRKYYDIALIELDRDAVFNSAVCPICLWPLDNLNDYSASLRAIGFGFTSFASGMSPTLQKVTLNHYDSLSCNNELPRDARLRYGLTTDQFCTKTPHKDACVGDSGGPLQIDLSDVSRTIPYLTGVVSFGTGCWDGSLGVYTKVSSYIDWIRARVNVTVDPIECARNSECLAARPFSDSRLSPQNNSPFFKVNLRRSDNSSFHQCTGALIDYRHVVTSATCAIRNNRQPAFIEANNELIEIVDINVHPKYVAGTNYHNLAVLTLGKFYNPNKIYQIVAPGCIWREERITDPIVFFSGYGPEVKNEPTDVAKNVSLKVLVALATENGRCEASEAWKVNSTLLSGFNSDFLCTYNPIDLVPGICKLEPGGAVSNFRRDNIVPYVYGINTMEEGACGGSQNLFVATRLSPFYDWIESIILKESSANDPIDTSIRFGEEDIDSPVPRIQNDVQQIINQNRIDVITQHLKPYGNDLMNSKPFTTVNVYHQSLNSTPETYEVYGPHSYHPQTQVLPHKTSLYGQPVVQSPASVFHRNDINIEIVPSLELPSTHTFHGQTPSTGYVGQHPVQSQHPYGRQVPIRGGNHLHHLQNTHQSVVDHSSLVSVIRSIELYENGFCALPTGATGRCLHYTRCPSMYWNGQNIQAHLRLNLVPFCNREQQTVCCQV
uniref:Peptidase S1 domain-containing protein n=1 Tax=Anopheles farauti TaxID=69004 RepID=A0A182QR08_9DIPT